MWLTLKMDSDKIEIFDIKYEVPQTIKSKTTFENLQLYLEVFCDVIQVIILYTIYLIKTMFTRKLRKDIGGKLALVIIKVYKIHITLYNSLLKIEYR